MTRMPNPRLTREDYQYIKHYLKVSANKKGLTMERRAEFLHRDISTLYRIRKSRNYSEYRQMLAASRGKYPRSRVALFIIAIAFVAACLAIGYALAGTLR